MLYDTECCITENRLCVRFEVLTVVTVKITAFWDVMMCSLVDYYQLLEESAASIFKVESTLGMEAAESFKIMIICHIT